MRLNELKDKDGARKARMRVGRGIGSGKGKTSGRGQKGAKARSGYVVKGFEGGQMPIHMRLPKRGFKKPFRSEYSLVNLGRLQKAIDDGKLDASKPVDEAALQQAGLFKRLHDGARLLAKGELSAKVDLTVTGASKAAVAAVEKAGGSVTVKEPAKAAAKAATEGKQEANAG